MENVLQKRGKGIILRKPNSFYHEKGSSAKLLVSFSSYILTFKYGFEREAIVVATNNQTLQCELPSGKTFYIPLDDRDITPGSVITFHTNSFVDGLPQNASFVRRRPDISVQTLKQDSKPAFHLATGSLRRSVFYAPSCRGCKRLLEDPKELRIQLPVLFSREGAGPYPIKINFCVNRDCVEKALLSYRKQVCHSQVNSKVYYLGRGYRAF
jgi:hypothetical protein